MKELNSKQKAEIIWLGFESNILLYSIYKRHTLDSKLQIYQSKRIKKGIACKQYN